MRFWRYINEILKSFYDDSSNNGDNESSSNQNNSDNKKQDNQDNNSNNANSSNASNSKGNKTSDELPQEDNYKGQNEEETKQDGSSNDEIKESDNSNGLSNDESNTEEEIESNQNNQEQEENDQFNTQDNNDETSESENSKKNEDQSDEAKQEDSSNNNPNDEIDDEETESQLDNNNESIDEFEEEAEISDSSEKEIKDKLELLGKLKQTLEAVRDKKEEEEIELGDNANHFLGTLDKLPPFDQRNQGPGYSIDTESVTNVDEIIIKTLINKFLNQRFCNKKEDLNVRSNSLEKSRGFLRWDAKKVVIHLETEQITKVLNDKYGYDYAKGKQENVPLSFYFDLSGSMSNFTNMLAQVAIELLKKDVKVIIGSNQHAKVQIDSIAKNIDVKELATILENYNSITDPKIKFRRVDSTIDEYLISHNAEKVCIFSDFDPKANVENLSHHAQVYWFCFESDYKMNYLTDYDGFIYPVKDLDTIAKGLIKVNTRVFRSLVYTENPKELRKVLK